MYFIFFFFKQKTAYEMRISDWSSDVCSSDLYTFRRGIRHSYGRIPGRGDQLGSRVHSDNQARGDAVAVAAGVLGAAAAGLPTLTGRTAPPDKIGRASGRERGCQSV